MLKTPAESQEVEPGRIELIAQELSQVLAEGKLVDWQERETLQSQMRNQTRVLLRKFGYPPAAREYIIENILKVDEDEDEA